MKNRKQYWILAILICLIPASLGLRTRDSMNVVVTSSWTGAYAMMAGAEAYELLAPSDMQHPTEYELQIEDIRKIRDADIIICGGYEVMMERIRSGLNIDPDKILQIKTDYNEDHIVQSVMNIANRIGTTEQAIENLKKLNKVYEESRTKISKAGLQDVPVIVQFFIRPLAEAFGMEVNGIFGPRQLEAFNIQEMMALEFDLILDNAHNPSAGPLAESKGNVPVAYLINFPGQGGTESLEDVINYNLEAIFNASVKNR